MFIKLKKGKAKDGGFVIKDNIHITRRELMVLMLMANGISNERISKRLGIKLQTVRNYLQNITRKLRAENQTHAVSLCIHYGMLEMPLDMVEDEEESLYVWCLHCGRTYLRGEFRKVKGEKFVVNHVKYDTSYEACPYEDCDGSALIDTFNWNYMRERMPELPEKPTKGVVYELWSHPQF